MKGTTGGIFLSYIGINIKDYIMEFIDPETRIIECLVKRFWRCTMEKGAEPKDSTGYK